MILDLTYKDNIKIFRKQALSNDDMNVVTLLYAPLVKDAALNLYLTLISLAQRENYSTNDLSLTELCDVLGMNAKVFNASRVKLEAIGLVSTYKAEDHYLMVLNAPMSAKQFLSDGLLGMYLYSEIGEVAFKRLQKLFVVAKIDKNNYVEVTASFDDVFHSIEELDVEVEKDLSTKENNPGIKVKYYNFNFDLFLNGISKVFLDNKRVTKRFEQFITNMAFAYGYTENEMIQVYNSSLSNAGSFDYALCSKVARAKFQEKYPDNEELVLPKLEVNSEVEESEQERLLSRVNAKNLIEAAKKQKVLPQEVDMVSDLYVAYSSLSRSVVNLCVLYAIKQCDRQVPAKNYFQKILDDWITKGIVTFEAANQEVIRKENASARRGKNPKQNDPDWLKEYVENFEEGVVDL